MTIRLYEPTRFVFKEFGGSELAVLVCPLCGSENVHLSAVAVRQGDVNTHVTKRAVVSTRDIQKYDPTRLVLTCFCESGCNFMFAWEYREGYTFFSLLEDDQPKLNEDL